MSIIIIKKLILLKKILIIQDYHAKFFIVTGQQINLKIINNNVFQKN